MLKYFHGAPTKINLHEHLTHEYFHTQQVDIIISKNQALQI